MVLKRILSRGMLVSLLLGITSIIWAQNSKITGVVKDSETSETLIGVSVKIVGTTLGTTTDFDGNFALNVSKNDVIEFSYTGYVNQKITVGDQTQFEIQMVSNDALLKEVVVVGYGVQKKSDLTGSVSNIRGVDLLKSSNHNAEQALQGKIAGVQVSSTSGAPGASTTIRIRGVGTFNNSSPIYVVDGVILDNISFLSSNDIESIEVLKDASSTAIYGSRGANGVVMVTTKQGSVSTSKPVYDFSAEYGIQVLAKKIDLLSGAEFGAYVNDVTPGSYNNLDVLPNTDWQDLIFSNAPQQNYHFSVAGTSDKQQYYIGVGFFNQQGIIEKSAYQRLSVKMNNTYKLNSFLKIGNNTTVAPFTQTNAPNVTYQAYRAQPVIEPFTADGRFAEVPGVGNPLADIAYSNNKDRGIRALTNFFADLQIIKPLTFRTALGFDYLYKENVAFAPVFYVSPQQVNDVNDLNLNDTRNNSMLWENTLTYAKTHDKHSFNVLAGFTAQKLRSKILSLGAENILSDVENLWYINRDNINPNSVGHYVDPNYNYSMLSYLSRANYVYDGKYLFTATFRRDGSSKFIKANRYGNFPSFAVGWNIGNEAFMDQSKIINKLKLRASWGKIGNEKISYLDQYALVTNGLNAVFGTGEVANPGSSYGKAGNKDIRWETTTQTDIGLEWGFWEDKLTAEFDFYNRVTDQILVELSTPGYAGNGQGQKIRYNAGKVRNRGIEFNLGYNGNIGGVKYRVGALGSTVNNKVLSVGGNSGVDSTLVGGFLGNGQTVTLTKEGLPVGAFYGYEIAGVYQNAEQLSTLPKESLSEVGDLIYVDQNKDGKINSKDRTYIGSPIPDFIYGFSFESSYKAFEFSFDFQGQLGNEIYNGKAAVRPDLYNFETSVLQRWRSEGGSNTEPRATKGGINWVPSSRFIQDGSYLRLRTVSIGYNLPAKLLGKARLDRAKLYLRGTNLWTLTKYTGYTPEIYNPNQGSGDVLSAGIDSGIYPISAIYTTGISITF